MLTSHLTSIPSSFARVIISMERGEAMLLKRMLMPKLRAISIIRAT